MPAKRTCECGTCGKCRHRDYMNEYYRRDPQRVRDIVKASRERRIADVQAYDRERGYRVYDLGKVAARRLLRNALRRGEVTRQGCEVCGASETDGHHEDYAKPLEVRWLCRAHHMEQHRRVA